MGAAEYAAVYAQWGDSAAALRWLATAARVNPPSLHKLKVDWMFDPIRGQPQFQALERRFNFPLAQTRGRATQAVASLAAPHIGSGLLFRPGPPEYRISGSGSDPAWLRSINKGAHHVNANANAFLRQSPES